MPKNTIKNGVLFSTTTEMGETIAQAIRISSIDMITLQSGNDYVTLNVGGKDVKITDKNVDDLYSVLFDKMVTA